MGNSDKTDKPAEDQPETKTETPIEGADTLDAGQAPDPAEDGPVVIEEPEAEVEAAEGQEEVAEGEVEEAVVIEEAAPVEDPQPVAAAPEPARSGFLPLVLGGVIAAGIGFGGAVVFGDRLGLGADTEAEIIDLRAQITAQADLVKLLQSNQDKIAETANAARESAGGLAALQDRAAALEGRIEDLARQVTGFDNRLTDIEKRPLNEGLSAAAIAAYEREVEELKALVAEQRAAAAELKDKADLSAQAALARSAATRIVAALDSGAPYRGAVVDYASATGQGVPAALEALADGGVVTLAALIDAYPEHARAALAAARDAKTDAGTGNKLGNFLRNQLGARSVEPKQGSDTDAVLSRAEAALREGRLADALAELDALADAPASAMAPWRDIAETRLAATQAAEDLAQSLNTN